MSTGEGSARQRRRLVDLEEAASNDPNEQQRVYYAMLASRLESLLHEIEEAGTSQDDELVVRLRALHEEVAPKAKEKVRRS